MEKQTILVGTVVPEEIYQKAQAKCEEQNTDLEQFVRSCIWSLAKGNLTISRGDKKD